MRSTSLLRAGAVAIGLLLPTMAITPAYANGGDAVEPNGLLDNTITVARGPLTDLSADPNPTDGGSGRAIIVRGAVVSIAKLSLTGLDPDASGKRLGVHIHTGACVEGDGDAAGPHYNHDKATGREPARVSSRTEVWLDVTVSKHGRGHASAIVPFAVPPVGDGIGSIVVHEQPTDHEGQAGGRLACLPL